jgi:hypothetical protein
MRTHISGNVTPSKGCKKIRSAMRAILQYHDQICIALRVKMGVDKYEFLRKCFFLPSARKLSDYFLSPVIRDPDGVLYSVVKSQQEKLEGHHRMKGKELRQKDFARHGSLAFDSMVTQGGLWFDPHIMKVIGYDEECFNL